MPCLSVFLTYKLLSIQNVTSCFIRCYKLHLQSKKKKSTLNNNVLQSKKQGKMKQIEKLISAENFCAVNLGKLSQLNEYVLDMGPEIKIPGKVFCGTALECTGGEFSFQMFQPGTETGFKHTHKNHEELYFFLSGNGEFQVDDKVFPITEGTVVRVSPNGKRSVRNNSDTPLIMLCIQYKANTFNSEDANDGVILHEPVKW